ncbi:MAG TPA: FAD-dependent oxidoreductase [Microbacterium sp.]|nr:FAD-dependent oxidoreductase [Microbacterium sp.]
MSIHPETDCVIAGGGPAGLMLGLLLARAGVDVVVVEKHADFLRDFRGDTIHPSTQNILDELGLLDDFHARPHADTDRVTLSWRGTEITLADFTHLPGRTRVLSFMPQWDFLDLLADAADRHPNFRLIRSTKIERIIRSGERIVGVAGTGTDGDVEIRARLVVGADGRDSTLREAAGVDPFVIATSMDVLWFRLPKTPGDRHPFVQAGDGLLITIDRGDFFQVAHVIGAGTWAGDDRLSRMKERVARISPRVSDAVDALVLDDVHLLRVRLERLRRWYTDGLLFIGDAAHAMSPAGGVGINLAIQDAVAAARLLAPILGRGETPRPSDLRRVQRRRSWPTRVTQFVQRRIQGPLLSTGSRRMPMPLRLLGRFGVLNRATGRLVGLGVRPEHVGVESRQR